VALRSRSTRWTHAVAAACASAGLSTVAAVLPIRAAARCNPPASASPAPSPSPSAEPPLYDVDKDIFAVDHDSAGYYSFQSNPDGSAKAKKELRVDQNLWNSCAQLQIRLPLITVYPAENSSFVKLNPFSGFGNVELRYSYRVDSPTFDHAITIAAALPTAGGGVESLDTELKFLYATKWRWTGGSIAYANEYDQTVILPPGARYTSYYQGTLTLPNYTFVASPTWKGLKISTLYEYRVLFNDGGVVESALGGIINGNVNDVAVNLIDTWGTGAHSLWKYRVEATAAARF
jgi:hypothetical protein